MTVMLLQRSASPQSTHSQQHNNNNNNNNNINNIGKPPFLYLLEQGVNEQRTNTGNHNHHNNNNNNNNHNNNHNNHNNNNKSAIINRNNSTTATGSVTAASSHGRLVASQLHEEGIAMRYYRLWIYACNVVLLGSALGFAAALARTLLFSGDARRRLVPGVPGPLDPTTFYAVLALAAQLGLVQLLGCVAARRLSAKLLNAYWLLLLALLFGDAVVGVVWVFRFERMRSELRPTLRLRLQTEYAKEARFSEQWDRLQREFGCCGVTGPRDFGSRWPQSCCQSVNSMNETCAQPFVRGCDESLLRWLRRTADLLFVLGFCVIAFAKLCFLGILRYEIREMIQKIRLLREPPPPATPFAQPQILSDPSNNNGGILRCATLQPNTATSGNATLLLQAEDCGGGKHPLLANALQDPGADSDTNSHCALILEETASPNLTNHNCTTKEKPNGNNNYEMREFNRRLLLSNGNNNQGLNVGGSVQNRRT